MERDRNLQKILLNKETPETPDNLEDSIMIKVHRIIKQKSENRCYLYLSWIFFIFGLVTGIVLSSIMAKIDTVVFGMNFSEYKLIIQIFCSIILLLLFERILLLTIETRNKTLD